MLSRSKLFADRVLARVPPLSSFNKGASTTVTSSIIVGSINTSTRTFATTNDRTPRFRRRTPKAFQKPPVKKYRPKKAGQPIRPTEDGNIGREAQEAAEYLYGDDETRERMAPDHEAFLRAADYMTADYGTTEDLVGRRRALMSIKDPKEKEELLKKLERDVEYQGARSFKGLSWNEEEDGITESNVNSNQNSDLFDAEEDPNQLAFGPWSETIVRVDRVQKVQRGGTMVRYRALVVGGNLNGCAGFGVAKANAPNEACVIASRIAKRNIFFIDRYNGTGLTRDLAGRQNSCKVTLRSVNPNKGLHGHPLIVEILKYFGITDCTAKSHGNRNIYNVVRATFKAIMTHESIEDIALKRGKKLLNLERAKRLKI